MEEAGNPEHLVSHKMSRKEIGLAIGGAAVFALSFFEPEIHHFKETSPGVVKDMIDAVGIAGLATAGIIVERAKAQIRRDNP